MQRMVRVPLMLAAIEEEPSLSDVMAELKAMRKDMATLTQAVQSGQKQSWFTEKKFDGVLTCYLNIALFVSSRWLVNDRTSIALRAPRRSSNHATGWKSVC